MATTKDYAEVIGQTGAAAGSFFNSSADRAQTKRELREKKRKNLADLLRNALKRDLSMHRASTGHQDESASMQGQNMQDIASGFANALKGASTRRK